LERGEVWCDGTWIMYNESSTAIELIPFSARSHLDPALLEPVEYRKSGLSLNHIIGCPLDCSYCVRHLFHNFEMKQPRLLMTDDEAVDHLVNHKFFQRNLTPLQLFNRATDPFLPAVRSHTFAVAENLDRRGLQNHLLIITRFRVTKEDCERLNRLRNLKITLLFTCSGITDKRIEPIDGTIAAESLKLAFTYAQSYRTIFYLRPLVSGLNDSDEHLLRAVELSRHAHATVFTGLFYRNEIRAFYETSGIPEPFDGTARRKIMPRELEARIIDAFKHAGRLGILFRKTSCGVAFVHSLPDYNGHFGIREICDICPMEQVERCRRVWNKPSQDRVAELISKLDVEAVSDIDDRAIHTDGLDEAHRYYIQHSLGYQVHDRKYPHKFQRHGRADIGWES